MHTSYTITSLRSQTKELGRLLRLYANRLCPKYGTKPLPGEAAAAYRRKAASTKKTPATSQPRKAPLNTSAPKGSGFNLQTYKIHALGDYADHIEQFGPTDCFSTQQGELEHRRVKRFYKRTNKTRFERQIAKHERMERHYRKYINTLRAKTGGRVTSKLRSSSGGTDTMLPRQHYSMAKKDRDHVDLYTLSNLHVGDPALKDFVAKLKDHLLARALNKQYDPEPLAFTEDDRNELYIAEDRLEQRYSMNVYHTTYDLRRGKDRVNMKNRSHVMTLSHDETHPYAYARVLGIFRVNVLHGPTMADEVRMDVLWVRWLKLDDTYQAGWKTKRLYRLKLASPLEDGAFGFLDPDDVVRGSHLIPGFKYGLRTRSPATPASAWDLKKERDWETYYVNQFVDRDMFMRYRGGGVGHKYMREVESKYGNMARTRLHGKQVHQEPTATQTGNEGATSGCDSDNEPGSTQTTTATGKDSATDDSGEESDHEEDEHHHTSEGGSGGDEEPEVDSDELASENDDYESYGLADP
ncbi:hypothetical protein BJ322DRAFT_1007005 [Thelephora terrestris]|uniref:Uncharacterized protein n=1 Tax=Thelephora terrestris TaxID=56493 RepID=A0A9P6HCV3_9AGAM|nr:hypothetical protein BJ322DRAFT_1007005 [Thelephora terrestris]